MYLAPLMLFPLRKISLILLLVVLNAIASAQNTRLNDHNSIGWYTSTINHKIAENWSAQIEYQWRRDQWISNWQQSLFRPAINYQMLPDMQLQMGMAWVVTFDYGDYPLNSFGKTYPEYRLHEQVQFSQQVARVSLQHRIRLEQRWVARFNSAVSEKPDAYTYTNRTRYMLRMQCPLQGRTLDDREFYAAAYDELFIGFGKNVGENIFDQNRIGVLAGYKVNKHLRVEAGYLNQTLQLGREIGNRNVLQYNEGIILNILVNTGNGS